MVRVRFRSTAFEPDVETWTSKHNGANTTFLSPCQSISLVRRPSTLATPPTRRAIGATCNHAFELALALARWSLCVIVRARARRLV